MNPAPLSQAIQFLPMIALAHFFVNPRNSTLLITENLKNCDFKIMSTLYNQLTVITSFSRRAEAAGGTGRVGQLRDFSEAGGEHRGDDQLGDPFAVVDLPGL